MRDVFVAGVGMTRFAKQPERNLKSLAADAVNNALADAEVELKDIEAIYFGNAVAGSITGQEMVRGQVTLRPMGVHSIPVINVENACASAASALHLAWLSVASGQYDVVLAVGAEKMTHHDKAVSFSAIGQAMDVELFRNDASSERSPLMDAYAESAREYMQTAGATTADFAEVVVKNQHNGAMNPLAQYGAEITVEQVLASRQVVEPLTLYMCSPISDGAAAAIVVSHPRKEGRKPIRIAASAITSGVPTQPDWRKGSFLAAQRAYKQAGLGPQDVDLAELHDAAASAEIQLYEQVGFAEPCSGPGLIRDRAVHLGGRIPVNPSGGLIARGHPIGATGLAQVFESVLQLRGLAGGRQVDGAKVALTQNGGGWLDGDNVAHSVHILVR